MSLIWFITNFIVILVMWFIITLLGFNQPALSFQWIALVLGCSAVGWIIANKVDKMFKK